MAKPGETIENPVTGERLIFRRTARETQGFQWEAEWFVKPHTGPAPRTGRNRFAHFHPMVPERFEIISGSARYLLGGVERSTQGGETVSLPAGIPHIHPWNAGDDELHMRQIVELDKPQLEGLLSVETGFETLFGLARDRKVDKDGLPNPLQMAVIIYAGQPITYVDGFPILVQQLLFGVLAGVGQLAGFRASYPAYSGAEA